VRDSERRTDEGSTNEVTEMMLFASAPIVGSGALAGASPMLQEGGNALGAWIVGLGFAGLVAGFLLIRRIGRSIDDADGQRSPWRFHGRTQAGPSFQEPRDTGEAVGDMTGRGLRGRHIARLMLAAALALDAMVVVLFASAPQGMGGGGWFPEPPRFAWLIPAFGLGLHVVGLAWMIRIIRANPERHASFWRSHRAGPGSQRRSR
jgi:hypothetical protein